jgi:hypothetical protein
MYVSKYISIFEFNKKQKGGSRGGFLLGFDFIFLLGFSFQE